MHKRCNHIAHANHEYSKILDTLENLESSLEQKSRAVCGYGAYSHTSREAAVLYVAQYHPRIIAKESTVPPCFFLL